MTEAHPERPLRVLVVEDEPVNRALLRAVLRTTTSQRFARAELIEAETLAEARSAVEAHRPDVIVLDVRLPDGDGLELARELRDVEASPSSTRPRVLVMSASVLETDRDAAQRSGGDAFLGKPFLPRELIAVLEALVGDA